jgi:hypothetical protein
MLPTLHGSDVPRVEWVAEIVHHINLLIPGSSLRPDPAQVGKFAKFLLRMFAIELTDREQFTCIVAVTSPLWPDYIVEIAHDSRQPASNWAIKYPEGFLSRAVVV